MSFWLGAKVWGGAGGVKAHGLHAAAGVAVTLIRQGEGVLEQTSIFPVVRENSTQ